MTVTGERPEILLSDVDFNRRDHPDRPLRPIPPGRDHYADQWRFMREFIFGGWIDIDREVQPSDLTRLRDDYFWQRDELMIGAVEAFERLGHQQGRALFEQALTQGIDTLEDPPQEFVDLFDTWISCLPSSISSRPSGAGCWRCRARGPPQRSFAGGLFFTRPR